MTVTGLVSGIGGWDKSNKARGGVEGLRPSTSGIDLRQGEGGEELRQVRVAFDAVETAFDMQEGGGGPAGDLVGLQAPAGDLGGLGAVVAHDIFNRVGGQQRDVEGGRDVELVQGNQLVAGLGETGGGGRVERGEEGLQGGERLATGGFALGQAQPSPQAPRLGLVALAQVAEEIALFVDEAALDDCGGPKREHRRLQGGRAVEDGQQAAAGRRPEASALQTGDQRGADDRVFTGPNLKVQEDLFPGGTQAQGDHHHRAVAQAHAIEHESEEGHFPEVALPHFGDLGRRGFDPVPGGRRLAHHALTGPLLAARAHARLQRGDDRRGVVARRPHGRVAREPVLLLRAIAGQLAHPRPDDRLAAPAGVAGAALAAGAPIRRPWPRIMTRSAQGGDLLQQHLLGNAAQAVAHQGQEKFLVLYRRGLRRRGWLVVFFHGWWFLGFLLPTAFTGSGTTIHPAIF
jgi:hypothetical protein